MFDRSNKCLLWPVSQRWRFELIRFFDAGNSFRHLPFNRWGCEETAKWVVCTRLGKKILNIVFKTYIIIYGRRCIWNSTPASSFSSGRPQVWAAWPRATPLTDSSFLFIALPSVDFDKRMLAIYSFRRVPCHVWIVCFVFRNFM